jgi:glucosamine-6-phosphate deaminase
VGGPRIVVAEDAAGLGRASADLVAERIAAVPEAWVAVATGETPMGLYAELAARCRSGRLDTSRLTPVQLDEYLGLEPDDRRTFFGWMRRSFLEPLGIAEERVVRLPVDGDLEAACAAFDETLAARGGLDLAILGIGTNGHLGFNEPPVDRDAPTRAVELSPATIGSNARYWGGVADVPTRAVTTGMRPLLSASAIVMVVSGPTKREIVHRALEEPVTPLVPGSFLQEAGADVTVVVDRAAWGDGDPS